MSQEFENRNFWIHSVEGGLYMGGIAFLIGESVLPAMVHSLGGSEWHVALMPALLVIGFSSTVLFVVPLLDRLSRFKPTVLIGGLAQRLPYLFAALALFFFAEDRPSLMLTIVVLAPLASGLVGGFTVNAWLEMVTRMIPKKRRAGGWAIRFIIQGLIGIAAGPIIHHILETHPGPPGYALLHLITFAFIMASLFVLAPIVETDFPQPPADNRPGYWKQLLEIPRKAFQVPAFLQFLSVRFTSVGYMILAPYMAIHALKVTNRPVEDVGFFVTTQMIGWIAGNILAARVGNRHGGKIVMLTARILLIALAAFVGFTTVYSGFLIAFFIFGFAFAMERVGDLTLGIELCPRENRSAFLALLTFVLLPAMLFAAAVAALLQKWSGNFAHAALAAALITAASLALLLRIREPRKDAAEEPIA